GGRRQELLHAIASSPRKRGPMFWLSNMGPRLRGDDFFVPISAIPKGVSEGGPWTRLPRRSGYRFSTFSTISSLHNISYTKQLFHAGGALHARESVGSYFVMASLRRPDWSSRTTVGAGSALSE